MNAAQELLTIREAAQMSGLSASTLKRRITAELLPARYTDAGTWVVQRSDLLAFLAVHEPVKVAQVSDQRRGASSVTGPMTDHGVAQSGPVTDHLRQSLDHERGVNAELREQVKGLQSENLKLNAEIRALLKGEGKGMLSRWFTKF